MGRVIETVEQTASTNADMLERARSGAQEGNWLRAVRQMSGRGRLGRNWESPQGNLYASTLIRIGAVDPIASGLALVAGLAVYDCVQSCLPEPFPPQGAGLRLKWPNDVFFDGAKLAGILLERADNAVVVGIGINVANAPDLPDRKTVCLHDCGVAVAVTPAILISSLADMFEHYVAMWRSEGMAAIVEQWLKRGHSSGEEMEVKLDAETRLKGSFVGLTQDGALRIRKTNGEVAVVHAGDVEVLA